MKKNFILIIFMCLFVPFAIADEWDDFNSVERAWDGQKTITNQEFEKVMDALEQKADKKATLSKTK